MAKPVAHGLVIPLQLCLQQQFCGTHPEGVGDLHDRYEGDVVFAPLDAAEVGAIEARFVCQGFLGHTLGQSRCTDRITQRHESGMGVVVG